MIASCIAVLLIAQYTPGSKPHSYSAGNVLYPGGAPPPTPAGAIAAPMGGYGQPRQHHGAPHPPHEKTVIVPVYFGAYFSEPEPTHPQPEPPVVIVNQAYRPEILNPAWVEPPPPPEPPATIQQADQSPTIYLIALNDGTIVAALGFWMDGDTLNYITRDAARNRISIDRVDRELSIKLNADRKLEFKLQ